MKILYWGKQESSHNLILRGDEICIYWSSYYVPTLTLKGGDIITESETHLIIKVTSPFGKIDIKDVGNYTWTPVPCENKPLPDQYNICMVDPSGRRVWLDQSFQVLKEEFFNDEESQHAKKLSREREVNGLVSMLKGALFFAVIFYISKLLFGGK